MLRQLTLGLMRFCKFKYYKQLANQINYVLPKINEELGYKNEDKCWIVGYRIKTKLAVQSGQQMKSTENGENNGQIEQEKIENNSIDDNIELEADPLARQQLDFGIIYKYAQQNDLDVYITDPDEKQVALVKLREEVYRKYYYKHVFKVKSTARKYKQIRIPENIHEHDMRNKVANIRQLIKKGQFEFKIYTQNDSDKSERALKRICQLLGKQAELEIQEHQIQQKARRQPSIVIERWTVTLDFSTQSRVNYEQVNKKWKRYLIQQKVNQKRSDIKNKFNLDSLINEPIEIQRQVLQEVRKTKIQMPKGFEEYGLLEDQLEQGGMAIFSRIYERAQKATQQTIKNQQKKRPEYGSKIQQIQKQYERRQNMEDQQQNVQQEEIKKIKNKNYIDFNQITELQKKQARKQMKRRTVQDILEEMEAIKGDKAQLQAFQAYKVQLLEKQLKETLELAGYRSKV